MLNFQYIPEIVPLLISSIVIGILLFAVYVTIKYRNTEQYQNTRISVFFSTLASVAIIFVGLNIVLSSLSFKYNQKFLLINKTKDADDTLWNYPKELLLTSPHIRPEFLASFYMSNPDMYKKVILAKIKTPLTKEAIVEEKYISMVMILSWVDLLTTLRYNRTPLVFWISGFLNWAQNPYFKEYYEKLKFGYHPIFIQFSDLLFEYAATIPVPTTDRTIYMETAKKMMDDPRFKSFIKGYDKRFY